MGSPAYRHDKSRFNVSGSIRELLRKYPKASNSRLWELCVEGGMEPKSVSRGGFNVACSLGRKKLGLKKGPVADVPARTGKSVKRESRGPRRQSSVPMSVRREVLTDAIADVVVGPAIPPTAVPRQWTLECHRVALAGSFLHACDGDVEFAKGLLDVVNGLGVVRGVGRPDFADGPSPL